MKKEKISKVSGKTIPLDLNDVDTDLIIPAEYLTSTTRDGYGSFLFKRLREKSPEFIFNNTNYIGASILIAQNNFGCGSSREHAVWALKEAGIKAIIAASFADIFYSNSLKNNLVLVELDMDKISLILKKSKIENYNLEIDLNTKTITSNCNDIFNFEMSDFQQKSLTNGFDEFEYMLEKKHHIVRFKCKQFDKKILPVRRHDYE